MASWTEVETAAPDFAALVRACFERRKHATLATLRANGAPRISGTEVEWQDGDVFLGSMLGTVKAMDLRRDPRYALHSPTVEPPVDDPSRWEGEAKLAGTAQELTDPSAAGGAHRFRLTVQEAVFTRVTGGRLEIQSWHEGRGFEVRVRD